MTRQAMADQRRVEILGVAVDRVDMAGAVERMADYIRRRRAAMARRGESGLPLPPLAHVVTANSEIVMKAVDNPDIAAILAQAALVVPDGIGVVWAARLQGLPVPARVAGIDLMEEMLRRCELEGWRPYFLGAAPGVAEAAAATLTKRFPKLQVAGMHHGYFQPEETTALINSINAAQPDLLLVALGAPRQEQWIDAHRSELQVAVAVGVGGSLDVWAGKVDRAPRWMCDAGLEWAYRLWRQPSRIGRMMALPRFAARVLSAKWRRI